MRSLVLEYIDEVYRDMLGNRAGSVADYIPELAAADPELFGIALATADGQVYESGDSRQDFTIQSISKPFAYALALADLGIDAVGAKVGLEPSGEPFNEISLDPASGRPRNPMINAGAIACTALVRADSAAARFERIRRFHSRFAGRELRSDEAVYESERRTGHRNRAIAHLLRAAGVIEGDPELALEVYFRQCAIEVDCRDLSLMAAGLAAGGVQPVSGERLMPAALAERVLSVMTTCGMYDAAGAWAARVGMAAKSGVSGGIIAVLPGQIGLAVYSPRLDRHGNSERGVLTCRRLSQELGLHFMHVGRAARSAIRASYDLTNSPSQRELPPAQVDLLRRHGHRAMVYELHGDLLFAAAETVIREATARADALDLMIVDTRAVGEVADISRRLLLDLRDQLFFHRCEVVLVSSEAAFDGAYAGSAGGPYLMMSGIDTAIEYCEDALIARYGAVIR